MSSTDRPGATLVGRAVALLTCRGVMRWGLPMTCVMPILLVAIGAQELPASPGGWALRFAWAFFGYGLVGGLLVEAALVATDDGEG
jgi:hypothetical protein